MNSDTSDISWLHISDLHIKSTGEYGQELVLNSLIDSLPQLLGRVDSPSFVVVSGDIAHSGQKEEYLLATALFDRVLSALSLPKERLFIVPGNHDIDRKSTKGLIRTLSSQDQSDEYFAPGDALSHLEKALKNFRNWYDGYFGGIRSFPDATTIHEIATVKKSSIKVNLFGINTALFCRDDNDFGKLWVGRRCLSELKVIEKVNRDEVNIGIMHHPIDWLSPVEASSIRTAMVGKFHVILRGHLHENEAGGYVGYKDNCIFAAAGACYQTRQWPNTANFGSIKNGKLSILPIKYTDTPKPVWAIDTSLFSDASGYAGDFQISGIEGALSTTTDGQIAEVEGARGVSGAPVVSAESRIQKAYESLHQGLFVSPNGKPIFFNPRIYNIPQTDDIHAMDNALQISIEEIVESDKSYLIESRTEYGGSTLAQYLQIKLLEVGTGAILSRSDSLPNYQSKLKREFSIIPAADRRVLIIDKFDLTKNEKLLRELEGSKLFDRVILIQSDRNFAPSAVSDGKSFPFRFDHIFIWTVGRDEIRRAAIEIFDSVDVVTISGLVEKVYGDLVGLCIPLTPANIVMYLRVLASESNYHPLNRVDILGRYLESCLRMPGDAYSSFFNTKSKLDFISEFVAFLYDKELHVF